MIRSDFHVKISLSLVLCVLGVGVAQAQRTPNETVPGGVEAKPSDVVPGVPKSQPAPAPAAPMVGSPSRGPSLETVPRTAPAKPATPPVKDPKAEKAKKKAAKAGEPLPLTRSLAPGAAAPVPGAAGVPAAGDESKPGAVERVPGVPKQP
jgi:hypothetical protein